VPTNAVFRMEGYYLRDPSVVKVDDRYHLFASRWPASLGLNGWRSSEVIRATSASLVGPYAFQEVVLKPSLHPWATLSVQSPKVMRLGDLYLLYHQGVPKFETGFAFSHAIEGPWEILPSPVIATQGAAIAPLSSGGFYAVGKSDSAKTENGSPTSFLQAFTAPTINGPYTLLGGRSNRLPGDHQMEDPALWLSSNRYHVVCRDVAGEATGVKNALAYYTSNDGITYRLVSPIPVWSAADPVPLADGTLMPVSSIESPEVFIDDDGSVAALLATVRLDDPEAPSFILIRPVLEFTP